MTGDRDDRVVVVVNPSAHGARLAGAWQKISDRIRATGRVRDRIDTLPDGRNVERVVRLVNEWKPSLIVAAGGDGTVNEVVQGLLGVEEPIRPTLAIVPVGTANNVARSLGLRSCRAGSAAVDLAVDTLWNGEDRRIDLGQANGRCFVGSFAIGMDADILRTRNRYRKRIGVGKALAGYPLYL